jgi:hypothetical protein
MTAPSIRRSVRGTNLAYASLAEWLDLVHRIGGRIRCARAHYDRCARLYRSLGTGDIRSSQDIAALEACERLFNRARGAGDIPSGYGLQRAFTRAAIGALLVETRNRIAALRSGRADRPRRKGPRFDPARIPDAALERLIQRHPDLDTVERLRAERRRRLLPRDRARGRDIGERKVARQICAPPTSSSPQRPYWSESDLQLGYALARKPFRRWRMI